MLCDTCECENRCPKVIRKKKQKKRIAFTEVDSVDKKESPANGRQTAVTEDKTDRVPLNCKIKE